MAIIITAAAAAAARFCDTTTDTTTDNTAILKTLRTTDFRTVVPTTDFDRHRLAVAAATTATTAYIHTVLFGIFVPIFGIF